MIDTLQPDKTNRKNLLAEQHSFFGMMEGPHPRTGHCYVMLFANEIVEKGSQDEQELIGPVIERKQITKNWDKFAKDVFDF